MAQDDIDVALSGLYTSVNPFSKAPEGALEVGDNIILRHPNLIEPRRGYYASTANPSGANSRIFPWSQTLMTFALNGDLRTYSDGAGWSAVYGNYLPPDSSTPIRVEEAAKSFFFTSSSGVQVLDQVGKTAYPAGLLPPLPQPGGTFIAPSTSGFLAPGASAAYRAVVCKYDNDNNLIQSAPSARTVVTNTSALSFAAGAMSKANTTAIVVATFAAHGLSIGDTIVVTLGGTEANFQAGTFVITGTTTNTFTYSDTLTQSTGGTVTNTQTDTIGAYASVVLFWGLAGTFVNGTRTYNGATFVQVYRSISTPAGVTPSDELFQVFEYTLTASNFTNNFFFVPADTTPDSFLSQPLYTNANTGSGIITQNAQPPLARDMCLFGEYMLYANTTERQTLQLQLIGTTGLVAGTSTITISGITYTAVSGVPGANQFQLFTAGTPAQNIQNTAQGLCTLINGTVGNLASYNQMQTPIIALYTSTSSGAPGLITLQELGIGGNPFTVTVGQNGQTCWVPDLSSTTYTLTSTNNRQPAKWWWSNPGEPWAVPPTNWAIAFAADQDILRIILVRSTVFFFKKDGLYTLTGNTPATWSLQPFDPGLVLLAPESCAVEDNQIFCWTNRGAVYVSESGVSSSIDSPIERDLYTAIIASPAYLTKSFGVSYENEALWLYALPTSPSDNGCSQQYVFNADSQTWTRWTIPSVVHGCFNPATQGLVWATGSMLWEERKLFNATDIQDPSFVVTPASVSGLNITFANANHGIEFGDLLSSSVFPGVGRVTAVNGAIVTTDVATGFAGGSPITDAQAIHCYLKMVPIFCQDPIRQKRFINLYASFKLCEAEQILCGFDTDGPDVTTFATLAGPGVGIPWDSVPYGNQPWCEASKNFMIRLSPAQSQAAASILGLTLNMQQAQAFWQMQGLKVVFDPAAELPRR